MSSVRTEWYQLRDTLERADFSSASILLDNDASLIDAKNGIGESVLHFLAVENNRPAVEWLHTRGADLNAANTFGIPLLFEVAQLGHKELLLWLIDHGADPEKKDAEGQQIIEFLTEYGKLEMIEFIKKHTAP